MQTKTVTLTITLDEAATIIAGLHHFERNEDISSEVRKITTDLRSKVWKQTAEIEAQ